jgi:hypothetical protein
MRATVDLDHPRRTRSNQHSPRLVVVEQVRIRRDQISLGELHRRFRTALGFGIGRHTRRDADAGVAADRDHLRMPDRHPGDMVDCDRALVVGQPIRRRTTKAPQAQADVYDRRRTEPLVEVVSEDVHHLRQTSPDHFAELGRITAAGDADGITPGRWCTDALVGRYGEQPRE